MVCGACGWSFAAEALRIRRPEDRGDEKLARLRREDGRGDIVFGAVLVMIGGLITALTYSFALTSGVGIYVIAYGPMIIGVIRIVQGLSKRFG